MNPTSPDEQKPEDQLKQDDVPTLEQTDTPEATTDDTTSAAEEDVSTGDDAKASEVTVKDPPVDAQAEESVDSPDVPAGPPVVTTAPVSADAANDASPEAVQDKDEDRDKKPDVWQQGTVGTVPGSQTAATSESTVVGGKPKKRNLVTFLVAVLGAVLIAGGVAFAYLGLVASNNPESVLRDAIYNTLEAEQVSIDGTVDVPAQDDAGVPAMKVDFLSQSDAANNASAATISFAVSGVDFSFEARVLDDNIYVKVGDLSTIKSLVGLWVTESLGTDTSALNALLDKASDVLSDQWIIIDSTLLDQFGGSCITESQFVLTENDKKILEEQFAENPFATVDAATDENVDGVETTRFNLTIDNKKGSAYVESLADLSVFKAVNDCTVPSAAESGDTELSTRDVIPEGETKLTVWVDKGATRIHKLAVENFELDPESKLELSFDAVLSYESFTVEEPENPKPALQVITELQSLFFSAGESLLGGL